MQPSEKSNPVDSDAVAVPIHETTEQQAARLVGIPLDNLHSDQLTEIALVADMMTHRSQYWKLIAAQLQQQSDETNEEAKRIKRLADALHAAAEHLADAKNVKNE